MASASLINRCQECKLTVLRSEPAACASSRDTTDGIMSLCSPLVRVRVLVEFLGLVGGTASSPQGRFGRSRAVLYHSEHQSPMLALRRGCLPRHALGEQTRQRARAARCRLPGQSRARRSAAPPQLISCSATGRSSPPVRNSFTLKYDAAALHAELYLGWQLTLTAPPTPRPPALIRRARTSSTCSSGRQRRLVR